MQFEILSYRLYKIILALAMLFCISMVTATAQQISGRIIDTTGSGIPNVVVSVLDNDIQTAANDSGFFALKVFKGTNNLIFSKDGYATQVRSLKINEENITIEITLQEVALVLNEVVVTANKKEERMLEVPSSMTSLSANRLQDTRTWKLENLVGLVPNFQYADVGVGYQQQIALRGVSVFSENPTVATYVDGVNALDISSNSLQFADVERIEILRGPQGTLYGRNAMAGVINIITKKPTNKTSVYSEVSAGSQGLQRYSASVKTPVIKNKLFAGFTGQFQRMHGYYTNDTTAPFTYFGNTFYGPAPVGVRFGDENSWYGNLSVRWLATDNSELTFNSKVQFDNSTGPSSYFQAAVDDSFALQNPYKFTVNRFGSNKRLVWNNSAAYQHHFKRFTLTSVSAYQYVLQAYDNVDFDYWSFDVAYAASYNKKTGDYYPQKVFSQEVRLSSASSSWLKWTVGAYFFNQVYNVRTATVYVPPLGLLFGYTGTDVSQSDRDNTGIAGFGQASVPLTPQVELTVGLRYDYESKRAQVALFNLDDSGNKTYKRPEERKSKTFEAFSPKAVIRYSIENNQQLYVSYARGYRAGGINMFANVEGYETFKPEFSDNYEVGYKTFSRDKKFMLTACFFLMHWTNLQLDYRPSSSNSWVTDNLGGVRSHGAELELTIAPIRRFTIEGSLGMIDARYEDFEYIDLQIGGNRTILAPDITSLIAPQYILTLSKQKNISVVFRGEWRHVGNQYFDLANTINQPAYDLFNASVGLRSKKAELFLWRQNINNVKFISYAAPAYFRYSLLGRPGSWGVTLTAKI